MVGAKKLIIVIILLGLLFSDGYVIVKVEQKVVEPGEPRGEVWITAINASDERKFDLQGWPDKNGGITYTLYVDDEKRDSCSLSGNGKTCYLSPNLEIREIDKLRGYTELISGEGHVHLRYITVKPGVDLIVRVSSRNCYAGGYIGFPIQWGAQVINVGDTDINSEFVVKLSGEGMEQRFILDSLKSREGVWVSGEFIFEPSEKHKNEGHHYNTQFEVVVDVNNDIVEFSEDNNMGNLLCYISPLPGGKDLTIGKITAPQQVKPGEEFSVEYEVLNIGSEPISSSFKVELLLGDQKVDERQVNGLGARSRKKFTATVIAPDKLRSYYFLGIADSENDVEEFRRYVDPCPQDAICYNFTHPAESNNEMYSLFPTVVRNSTFQTKITPLDPDVAIPFPEDKVVNETVEEIVEETEEVAPLCEKISCKNYCSGKTLYSNGKCNEKTGKCEYSKTECENGCDTESAKCIQVFGNVKFDVFIDGYDDAVASGKDTITVTARLMDEGMQSIAPIEGATVKLELASPQSAHVFRGSGGRIVAEGKTDSNGEFKTTFEIPQWDEFYLGRQSGETSLKLDVRASKQDSLHDFSYSDGPYTIKVASPAIEIQRISIDPSPAQAYGKHKISIKTLDRYEEKPAQFTVKAREGTLSHGGVIGEYGGGIGFDSYAGTAVVNWQAPERGLTPYEFSYAKEVRDVNKEGAVALGSSIIGSVFPVVKSGETIYGMYGDFQNIGGEIGQLDESLSVKEGSWRLLDASISSLKIMVGSVDLIMGFSPGVGAAAKELLKDGAVYGIEQGQAKIKQKAAEARLEQMETRSMDIVVEVEVVDAEGYYERDYLIFKMEYHWVKGAAEGIGGGGW